MKLTTYVAYLAGAFGVGAFAGFNHLSLSLWLYTMTTSHLLIALLSNTRSFEGALVSPIFGAWSDRIWAGWLGRRRPFILVGGLLSAVLLAATPAISRLPLPAALGWLPPDVARLAPAIAAIFLFTLALNSMDDVHQALLADLTEGAARNRLAALRVVVEMAGHLSVLAFGFMLWSDGIGDAAFLTVGGLMAIGILATVLGVREPPPHVWSAERQADTTATGSRLSPRKMVALYPGAAMFFLVMLAYWAGLSAIMPLVSIYVVEVLQGSISDAMLLPALFMLTSTALAVPVGQLATRLGKRRVLAAGLAGMALAGMIGMAITTVPQGMALFLIAGAGNAAVVVLTIPMLADLVPRHHMGIATGLIAASGSAAAPLSAILGGGLSDMFGPRAIFGLMALSTFIALGLLSAVRSPRDLGETSAASGAVGTTAATLPADVEAPALASVRVGAQASGHLPRARG